ncbi:MAG: transposase, partial [Saprospiraceae bacterium]|nr:transposase [Saprospiraceae bacterium]
MLLPRRNFSKEQKLEIVNQTMEPGCDLEAIADSYKVHVNTLYKWRREYLRYEGASFPG